MGAWSLALLSPKLIHWPRGELPPTGLVSESSRQKTTNIAAVITDCYNIRSNQ